MPSTSVPDNIDGTAADSQDADFHQQMHYVSPVFMKMGSGIALVVVLALLVALYVGLMTERWMPFTGLEAARMHLRDAEVMPMVIGDWEALEELTLSKTDLEQLRIKDGYISRRYRNIKTQAEVHFTIMVGHTGLLVVHTPEICFGGRDYINDGSRVQKAITVDALDSSETYNDNFWRVSFTNPQLGGGTIMFYYAVSAGSEWNAVKNPRSTFSKYRYVYKIQVQALVTKESDAIEQFLYDCLPTIHQAMLKHKK